MSIYLERFRMSIQIMRYIPRRIKNYLLTTEKNLQRALTAINQLPVFQFK